MKALIYIATLILLVSSCNSSFHIEKRRYNKGFYFTHLKNTGNIANNENQPEHTAPIKINSDQKLLEKENHNKQSSVIAIDTNETATKINDQYSNSTKIKFENSNLSQQDETTPDEEIIKKRRNNLIASIGFGAVMITSLTLINTLSIGFGILAGLLLFPTVIFFLKFFYINEEATKRGLNGNLLSVLLKKRKISFSILLLSFISLVIFTLLVISSPYPFSLYTLFVFGLYFSLATFIVSLIIYSATNRRIQKEKLLPDETRLGDKSRSNWKRALIFLMIILYSILAMVANAI